MRSTRTRAAALLAVAGLALTGCGRDSGGEAGAEGQGEAIDDGKASGTIEVWAMGTEGEVLQDFAAAFTEANPDAKVEVTAVPWDGAHDKIANAIAAGETPDVSLIGTTWMGEFAEAGGIEPMPEGLVEEGDFFPGAWESTEVGGTSYGVPWYVETRALYYRTDLAEQAGWSQPPATWDELRQFATDLQDKAGAAQRPPAPGRQHRRLADDDAVRLVRRRRAHRRRRRGVHARLPRDGRRAGVLRQLLRRRPLVDRQAGPR